MIRTDLARCSMLAGLFVFLLVLSYFRSVPRTLLAMLPVALGTVLMIGFMGYMNIDFTMMTVVIVPLVIGSGIDYGVHILSRWYLEQKDTLQALRRVVTPVIGAILTSMIGFGSLILSDTPGFRQLGLVAMAGLGFCLLISLFVLPQILNVFESNRSA
jgi:predicted RND superfamily exporter protein